MKKVIFILLVAAITIISVLSCNLSIKPDKTLSFILNKDLNDILYYASLAPSGHNTQAWIVDINEQQSNLTVYLDSSRRLLAADPEARESYLSIGAFLENLNQAFIAYGYRVNIQIENPSNSSNNPLVARVYFTQPQHTSINQSQLAILEKRHTDKRPFLNDKIEQSVINQLTEQIDQLFYFDNKSTEFSYLQKTAIDAYKIQVSNQNKRDELADWLRYSDSEAKNKGDGLPAELLGITGISKALYYLIIDKEMAKQDNFASQGLNKTQQQVDNCVGFFILTGNSSVKELILTGMQMEKFWLIATKHNIALQPMSQMLEEMPFNTMVQHDLKLNQPIQMVFRAGYLDDYGQNHRVRRDLNKFIFSVNNN